MSALFAQQNFGDSIIDFFNNLIPQVITNAPNLFNSVIGVLILIIAFFWLYVGFGIFIDAKQRFKLSHEIYYYLILLFGLIGGPIAVVIYNMFKPRQSQAELDFIKVEHKFYYHQASKVVDCLYCEAYVLEGQSYCTNCGTQNRFKCTKCGALTDYDDLYCFSCGLNFGKRSEEILQSVLERKKSEALKNQEQKNTLEKSIKTPGFDFNKTVEIAKSKLDSLKAKSKELALKASNKANELKNSALRRDKSK